MSSLSATATAALAAVEADPRQAGLWEDLLYHLGQDGLPAALWSTLPLMAQHGINRAAVVINACARLAEDGCDLSGFDPLTADPFSTALSTVVACCRGRQAYLSGYDLNAACSAYDRAVQQFPFVALTAASAALGREDERATVQEFVWTRGLSPLFALSPPSYSAGSLPQDTALPWPDLPIAGDSLIMASADDGYCRIYGERLLDSVARYCPQTACLLHVMNPTDEGERVRQDWRQRYPFAAFVTESAPADVPYYAARRFMLINAVRRHYGRAVVLMDMDGYLEQGMPELLPRLRQHPLALIFRRPTPVRAGQPNILYDAFLDARCVYAHADSVVADRFFDRTAAYLAHKRADDAVFWCWDESALCHAFCCLDAAERAGIADMTALDSAVLQHGIATGNLHHKTQGQSMTSNQPFAQRILARILGRLFDPVTTPQPFQMLLQADYQPPILRASLR